MVNIFSYVEKKYLREPEPHVRTANGLFFALFCVILFTYGMSFLITNSTGLLDRIADKDLAPTRPQRGTYGDKGQIESKIISVQYVNVENLSDLVNKMKAFGLWELDNQPAVKPVIFNSLPRELANSTTSFRKKVFFNSLLPSILVVQAEIDGERKFLKNVLNRLNAGVYFDFTESAALLKKEFSQQEIKSIDALTAKYKASSSLELLERVGRIPVSLVLAQGAIESSWGSSRFCRQGNNLFGIWTWNAPGLIPERRDSDKRHKVAVYPALLDSIRAYSLILNRVAVYSGFRAMRKQTKNSMRLAEGLARYSERGQEYVDDVKNIIRRNNLQRYDRFILQKSPAAGKQL